MNINELIVELEKLKVEHGGATQLCVWQTNHTGDEVLTRKRFYFQYDEDENCLIDD